MMLRRHSSSASEAPLMDATNGTNYTTPDERRWSIAAHEVPQDYQHVVSPQLPFSKSLWEVWAFGDNFFFMRI